MPFGNAFGWPHLLIILAIVLLLFGATRLPALSRSLGQSIKEFRKGVKDEAGDAAKTADKAESTTDAGKTDKD